MPIAYHSLMALLNRLKLRNVSAMKNMVIKGCQARIMNIPDRPEFLLQEMDLVNADEDYLKCICEKEFLKKFGVFPSLSAVSFNREIRRLSIILPLYITGNKVIPIPFIVDTGAPDFMYLGTGALRELKKAQVIKDVSGRMDFRLLGNLVRGERSVEQPYAGILPLQYEEINVRGDPRLNVLGLAAIGALDIKIDLELIH